MDTWWRGHLRFNKYQHPWGLAVLPLVSLPWSQGTGSPGVRAVDAAAEAVRSRKGCSQLYPPGASFGQYVTPWSLPSPSH